MKPENILISASLLLATAVYAIPIPKISTRSPADERPVEQAVSNVSTTSSAEVDKYRNGKLRVSITTTAQADSSMTSLARLPDGTYVTGDDSAGTTQAGSDLKSSVSSTTATDGKKTTVTILSTEVKTSGQTTTLTGQAAADANAAITAAGGGTTGQLTVTASTASNTKTIRFYNKQGKEVKKIVIPIDSTTDSHSSTDGSQVGSIAVADKTDEYGNTVHASASSDSGGSTSAYDVSSSSSGDAQTNGGGGPDDRSNSRTIGSVKTNAIDMGRQGAPATEGFATGSSIATTHDGDFIDSFGNSGSGNPGENSAGGVAGAASVSVGGADANTSLNLHSTTGSGSNGRIKGDSVSVPNVKADSQSSSSKNGGAAFGESLAVGASGNGGTANVQTNQIIASGGGESVNNLLANTNSAKSSTTGAQSASFSSGKASDRSSATAGIGGPSYDSGQLSASNSITSGSTASAHGRNKQNAPGASAAESISTTAKGQAFTHGSSLIDKGSVSANSPSVTNMGTSDNFVGSESMSASASTGGGRGGSATGTVIGGAHAGNSVYTEGSPRGGGESKAVVGFSNKGSGRQDVSADARTENTEADSYGGSNYDPSRGSTEEQSSASGHAATVATAKGKGRNSVVAVHVADGKGNSEANTNVLGTSGQHHSVSDSQTSSGGNRKSKKLSD